MVESPSQKGLLSGSGRDGAAPGQSAPVKRQPGVAAFKQRFARHAPEPYAAMASRGDWSSELWDVCAQPGGFNMCCLSLWCPCIQYGLLLEQLPPGSVTCAGSSAGSCALFCVLWLLGDLLGAGLLKIMPLPCTALVHAQMRGHIRSKYGIQSHPLHDFFITWCCAPCALCQEAREVVIRQAAEAEAEDSASRLMSPSRSGSAHGPMDHGPMGHGHGRHPMSPGLKPEGSGDLFAQPVSLAHPASPGPPPAGAGRATERPGGALSPSAAPAAPAAVGLPSPPRHQQQQQPQQQSPHVRTVHAVATTGASAPHAAGGIGPPSGGGAAGQSPASARLSRPD